MGAPFAGLAVCPVCAGVSDAPLSPDSEACEQSSPSDTASPSLGTRPTDELPGNVRPEAAAPPTVPATSDVAPSARDVREPSRNVGVGVVRQLYGVVEAKRASGGLLATTSFFSPDAKRFQEEIPFRLELKDYLDLVSMLQSAADKQTATGAAWPTRTMP
ncbi:MAG: restriction endonuclease, partial [Solirubrobacteraceae bacterium]